MHKSQHETALIAHGTIEWASLFHIMCLCSTTTPPPSPPPPCILQGVWPSLCCQSPPSTQEASIQWPTPNILWGSGALENKSWEGRRGEEQGGRPFLDGCGAKWRSYSFGLMPPQFLTSPTLQTDLRPTFPHIFAAHASLSNHWYGSDWTPL